MIEYNFSYTHPHRHYLDIEMRINEHSSSELILQLPAWRPGRYELGNFAKNIQSFKVFDVNDYPLKFEKITKDTWKVSTPNVSEIVVRYNYYSNELNAGSTYLDEKQMYVNPVNCCLYVPNRMGEACEVNLHLPEDYELACSLLKKGHQLISKNYDQLAESPWIASKSLQHNTYEVNGIKFHVWFQGKCEPDWDRILKDFRAFTTEQISDFSVFPVSEYHFINQILPYKAYHGVEHTASTVISLGPGDQLMEEKLYNSLLGVSSHELYHTWNIKQIRPKTLLPYDYSKENYSRMGYLYEGVTTYMGDLYLMRSKVFSEEDFYKTQEENLQRHFHNGGRYNMSVADASFDTWLDGYEIGVPNRKVSIYTEGALCALMIDICILHYSNGQNSLRDVMTKLYHKYGKEGLSEQDYIHEIIGFGGDKALNIIENHVYGTKDFRDTLDELLALLGLQINEQANEDFFSSKLGVKGVYKESEFHIKQVLWNGVADTYQIGVGDVVQEICGQQASKELVNSLKIKSQMNLKLKSRFDVREIEMNLEGESYYPNFKIERCEFLDERQKFLLDRWL